MRLESVESFAEALQTIDVLIVDDDSFIRSLLYRMLTDSGYSCVCAENGEDAVNLALYYDSNNARFRLVLMDCDMPVLDGWAASK